MIMPSAGQGRASPIVEPQALFAQHGVEAQLDAMFSNHVTLRSGGYLVINPTEALVSIDVNSGRATREHNIEDTARQDQPGGLPRRSPDSFACATSPA